MRSTIKILFALVFILAAFFLGRSFCAEDCAARSSFLEKENQLLKDSLYKASGGLLFRTKPYDTIRH